MTDTDDTDELLLIPPDFFVIESDTEPTRAYGPYYNVVDNLITQVNKLGRRINHIETKSKENSLNSSSDQLAILMSGPTKKYLSFDDLPHHVPSTSAYSTPQKPRTRPKLHSLPSTPSSSTVHQKPPKITDEIDNFVSNVKAVQQLQAARSLYSEFESHATTKHNVQQLDLNQVNVMLRSIESQQQQLEHRLARNEDEIYNNRAIDEEFTRQKTWCTGDNKSSVPDLNLGMRDVLYRNEHRNVQNNIEEDVGKIQTWQAGDRIESVPDRGMGMRNVIYDGEIQRKQNHSTLTGSNAYIQNNVADRVPVEETINRLYARPLHSSKPLPSDSESLPSDNERHSPSLSSSDSTQNTVYQNVNSISSEALKVLNKHKQLLCQNTSRKGHAKQQHYTSPKRAGKKDLSPDLPQAKDLALLSLAELWDKNNPNNKSRNRYFDKLEEERLRRQHCEQLIQDLQSRALELQERLAVAVQVDQAKNEAILRFHKSCENAVLKLDSVSKEKLEADNKVADIQAKYEQELEEAKMRLQHIENESSKNVSMMQSNFEKLETVEREKGKFVKELEDAYLKLAAVDKNYNVELERNRQMAQILTQKEIELNENKNVLQDARQEVLQSKQVIETCHNEMAMLKQTCENLEQQIQVGLAKIKQSEKEKKSLISDVDVVKAREKALQDELKQQKDMLEKNKNELRSFYQNQVEIVVRDKLKEFQEQLEKAETGMQDELHNREFAIARTAASHIQQINEKHTLEINLLEEKHREQLKLHQIQISSSHQEIDNLRGKLRQQFDKRQNIAQQLRKVMEANWLEALKIINNGKSPVVLHDKSAADQLNSLKSKSYTNLEEILLLKDDVVKQQARVGNSDNVMMSDSMSSMIDDSYSNKMVETPVSSRGQNRQATDSELQKYIQMLLNRPPSKLLDDQREKSVDIPKNGMLNIDQFSSAWHSSQMSEENRMGDNITSSKASSKERLGKPPWK